MLPSAVQLLGTPRASEWKGCGPVGSKSHTHRLDRDYLDAQVIALVPTPLNADAGPRGGTTGFRLRDWSRANTERWGQYAPAIGRWEALTRPAPAPTDLSAKGNPRLSAAFSEWLMGLPAGWITDVPGITRNEALKAAGNGVVWQQAEAALRFLLDVLSRQETAA